MHNEVYQFLLRHLATDANTSNANSTLELTVVSGIITIVVAFVSVWGTRVSKKEPKVKVIPGPSELDEAEANIERLERYCYLNGIDPMTGNPLPLRGGRHERPTSGSRTSDSGNA